MICEVVWVLQEKEHHKTRLLSMLLEVVFVLHHLRANEADKSLSVFFQVDDSWRHFLGHINNVEILSIAVWANIEQVREFDPPLLPD